MVFINITEKLLEFVYPSRCLLCGRVVSLEGEIKICPSCWKTTEKPEPPFCIKCGRHIGAHEESLCDSCSGRGFAFDAGGILWPYEGKMARAVLDLKFNNKLENAKTIGLLCADDIIRKGLSENIDALIPVPLHRRKMNKRGYNQAELIASVIGKRLKIPVATSLLVRVRNTVPQMSLDFDERLKNISGAIKAATAENVKGKSFLLIDDIFTTGSTIDECSRELKKNGAKKVNCYCVCI